MKRYFFPLLFFLTLLGTGCVSQYKVVVEFSSGLQGYFTEFPSIETDIMAVTDSEADEVKKAGVEKYFAPDSGFRERFQSQTCFFNRENQSAFVLPSRAPVWKEWQLKNPTKLLIIASLPHDAGMSVEADPRLLLVKMTKSYVFARTVTVLVDPKKVIQITSAPKSKASDTTPETEQWIETRSP